MENSVQSPVNSDINHQSEEVKPIKTSTYVPGEKNGKWDEDEHLRYIAFIDFYKEKMRSKEKRRSNEFYKEMSNYISTRNGLQCRSHHQKLQEKYIYTNKIISAFKDKFDPDQYKSELRRLKQNKVASSSSLLSDSRNRSDSQIPNGNIQTVSVAVQTQLQGLNVNYIHVDARNVLMYQTQNGMPYPSQSFYFQPTFWYHPGQ